MRPVYAMWLALALSPSAWAMQNIKCKPADRALIAQWTDVAGPAKDALSGAREGVQKSGALSGDAAERFVALDKLTGELLAKVESSEVKGAFATVDKQVDAAAAAFAKSDPEASLKALDALVGELEKQLGK